MPQRFANLPILANIDGNPIPYRILPDVRASLLGDRQEIEHIYMVQWHRRLEFERSLLGYSEYVLGSNALQRWTPHRHPEYPHLYVSSLEMISGVGVPDSEGEFGNHKLAFGQRDQLGQYPPDDSTPADDEEAGEQVSLGAGSPSFVDSTYWGRGKYGYATYRVVYTHRDYAVKDNEELLGLDEPSGLDVAGVELGRYVTRTTDFAVENLIVPTVAGVLRFVNADGGSGDGQMGQNPVIPMPTATIRYKWWDVPAVPRAAIAARLGMVNEEVFDNNYDPETMLFAGTRLERGRNIRGKVNWNIEFLFLFRPYPGWNYFLDKNRRFSLVTLDGTDNNLYLIPNTSPTVAVQNRLFWRTDLEALFVPSLPVDDFE